MTNDTPKPEPFKAWMIWNEVEGMQFLEDSYEQAECVLEHMKEIDPHHDRVEYRIIEVEVRPV